MERGEGQLVGVGEGALDGKAADGVGPVKDDDGDVAFAAPSSK